MVKTFKLIFLCLLFITGAFYSSCDNDIFGIFGTTDLAQRLKEKDKFVFLSESDRNLSFGEEYSFLVLSDTHIEDGDAFGLEKLKDIVEADSDIKFAVFTGDITQNGDKKDVKKFIEIAKSLGVPCYPVIGNHDIYFGNWTTWRDLIGSTNYRINGGGTTLFILDSANAYLGKDQLDWLEMEIKTAEERVFVFSHANIFVGEAGSMQQFTDTNERARLVSILKNKCDIMFVGHVHARNITEAGNVKYITIEDYVNKRIYCVVLVRKNGVSYRFEKL